MPCANAGNRSAPCPARRRRGSDGHPLTELTVGGVTVVTEETGVTTTTSGTGWSYADGTLTLSGTNTISCADDDAIYAVGDLKIVLAEGADVTVTAQNGLPIRVWGDLSVSGKVS